MDATDAELIRRVLSNRRDEAASRGLVERHSRAVFNLAYRLLGNTGDAEDVAQESFLKAFQRLSTFDQQRRFTPWLLRITHNTAIDALRRARSGPDLEGAAAIPDDTPDPVASLEHAELSALLQWGLDQLRPSYRAALVLRYQEGLSYADVSVVMGVPEGTAKTYVHRARRDLAELLRARGVDRDDR